jgi:thiamine biosynthesis lipoprotein ApbE
MIIRAFVELRQQLLVQPESEILREKVKRIESEIGENKLSQLAENQSVSGKVVQLSREVISTLESIRNFSEISDGFQDSYLIIKRPDSL